MLRFSTSVLFDGKVNIVGASGRSKFKFPIVFKNAGKNNIKMKGKRVFLLVFGVTLKQMNVYT